LEKSLDLIDDVNTDAVVLGTALGDGHEQRLMGERASHGADTV